LIDDIESELHNSFRYEVDSRQVGDMILVRLRKLDRVAYVRFASVYKEFQDLDEFTSELKALR
jgi:transcriptional repressor NrdR